MPQKLFGTNCGNCRFFGRTLSDRQPVNAQGGLRIAAGDLKRAKAVDLITLPGKQKSISGPHQCTQEDVDQPVNDRMCCAKWDNPDADRQF